MNLCSTLQSNNEIAMASTALSSTATEVERQLNPFANLNSGIQASGVEVTAEKSNSFQVNSVGAKDNSEPRPFTAADSYSTPADQTKTAEPNMNDGNFHPSAEPHNTIADDDDDDMKITPAEEAEHEQRLKDGARNATQADPERQKLPPHILELYKDAYKVVRENWWEDQGLSHNDKIAEIDAEIAKQNMQNGVNFALYKFPASEIRTTIDLLRNHFKEVNENTDRDDRKAKELVKKIVEIANDQTKRLERLGVPWQLLLPNHIKEKFEIVLKVAAKYDLFGRNAEFLHPVQAQKALCLKNNQQLDQYFAALTSKKEPAAEKLLGDIIGTNNELASVNRSQGRYAEDHQIPIEQLKLLLPTARSKEPSSAGKEAKAQFKAMIKLSGLPEIEQLRQVPENDETSRRAIRELLHFTDGEDEPRTLLLNGHVGVAAPAIQQRAGTSSLFLPAMDEYDDGDINPPSYVNGVTHLGKIIGARKLSRGYRFLLNAGTEAKPLYKIFAGAEFGRGMGDQMYDGGLELKRPTIPVKDRKSSEIASIRNHVQVASDKANRQRAPPTYFLVEYKNNMANPHAGKAPLLEWLTMSELITICGAKYVKDRVLPASEGKYQRNAKFFADMKRERLHPDTKAPLTREDKRDSPWLFPEDDTTSVIKWHRRGDRRAHGGKAVEPAEVDLPMTDETTYGEDEIL